MSAHPLRQVAILDEGADRCDLRGDHARAAAFRDEAREALTAWLTGQFAEPTATRADCDRPWRPWMAQEAHRLADEADTLAEVGSPEFERFWETPGWEQ